MNTNTAVATEQFVAMEVKIDAKLVRKILGSAAYLVATNDPEHMVKRKKLSLEVRDSLDILREEMHAAELLVPYLNDSGELRI